MRKTKIICTLGPSTEDEKILRALMENGMDVARINMSHGSHEEHKKKIDKLKKLRSELELPVAILLDTKGPEIRIGRFAGDKKGMNAFMGTYSACTGILTIIFGWFLASQILRKFGWFFGAVLTPATLLVVGIIFFVLILGGRIDVIKSLIVNPMAVAVFVGAGAIIITKATLSIAPFYENIHGHFTKWISCFRF